MTRALILLVAVCIGALACAPDDDAVRSGVGASDGTGDDLATRSDQITLAPRVVLLGLNEIDETIRLNELAFEAEIFVLPDDRAGTDGMGDVASVAYEYVRGRSLTSLLGEGVVLPGEGTYHVSVQIRAMADEPTVQVSGEYTEQVEQDLGGGGTDRAPYTPGSGDQGQSSDSEPTPEPMDGEGDEPTPEPMDGEGDEPTPEPMEPTPEPMDGEGDEPTPEPMDEGEGDEPTPEPMDEGAAETGGEGAATGGADRDAEGTFADEVMTRIQPDPGDPIQVDSFREFTFYAGTVEVRRDSTDLIVTWDVRGWLRALLAQALGLQVSEASVSEEVQALPGEMSRGAGRTWQASAE
jgi:hypothetical protein